jgi:hypothetical protein
MKRIDHSVSKSQRDIWTWKDQIYQQVRDLPVPAALAAILDQAEALHPARRTRRRTGGRGIPAHRDSA